MTPTKGLCTAGYKALGVDFQGRIVSEITIAVRVVVVVAL